MEISRPRQGFREPGAVVWHAPISPEILSGRAGLSGVREVLYGTRSRRALRAAIHGLLDETAVLGPCRLDRAKFKPGRKLTGYFIVSTTTPSGERRRGLEVVWSDDDGTSVPGAAALEDEARALGVLAPFRSLHYEAAGLRVSVAPLDPGFPHLVRLSDPAFVGELLSEVYRQEGGGLRPADAYDVTTVRYRPRQRHLLRYDPRGVGGTGGTGETVFAKLYSRGGAEKAMRVAAAVADAVEQAGAGVRAVRPLGEVPVDDVVLYPRLDGKPLSAHLPASVPRRQLFAAGALLRSLHDHGLERADVATLDLRRNDLAGELPATARATEHLQLLVPDAAAQIEALLTRVGELDTVIPGEPATFAHGDYKCDHLWVSGRRLTVLDFDTCSLAEPALDVGKFLADLTWHYMHFRPDNRHGSRPPDTYALGPAQQAFLDGYGPMPDHRLFRSRLVEVVILTKISIRRRRRFQPDFGQAIRADLNQAVLRLRALEVDASVS
jgi:hypothetical protein